MVRQSSMSLSTVNIDILQDLQLTKIDRFDPPGSLQKIDQLFYPSALFFQFDVLSDMGVRELRVQCLQQQVRRFAVTAI